MILPGGPLEERDYASLEQRWITRELADGALLRRVASLEGAELVGREQRSGDYSGIVISYVWPGDDHVRTHRIRRDNPDLEAVADGSVQQRRKYMGPPGRGNAIYLPPQAEARLLDDVGLPAVIVEGEFKTLALWRLAWHGLGDTAETPAFLPVGLQGVFSWRGKVGRAEGATPQSWADVKGPVVDLGRIAWNRRKVIILFDADVETNAQVGEARRQLTRELEARGAVIWWFKWPADVGELKGIDDFLAGRGPDDAIRALGKAKKVTRARKVVSVAAAVEDSDWKSKLLRNDDGGIRPILANAITYLREAPDLVDMLAWDEFAVRTMALKGTPWNPTSREWGEVDDILLADWLQHAGCRVSAPVASQAVAAVARDRAYHPVREYLSGLQWDKTERIDLFLSAYFGVRDSKYARAVGSRWLISAVARVMEPGCKADHCLILQGPQGPGKSSALRALAGGEWFADQVGSLEQKDSAQQIAGVWIVEFGELEQVLGMRAELAVVKAFITRQVDRYRPPYERRPANFPRQCIFAGSVNLDTYLRDETGNRRFWPAICGEIHVKRVEQDRDQLWAEARARFEAREPWWLDTPELVRLAEEEQDAHYEADPWDVLVWDWIEGSRSAFAQTRPVEVFSVSIDEILRGPLKKPDGSWTPQDKFRIGRILRRHGMVYERERVFDLDGEPVRDPNNKQRRRHCYRWPTEAVSVTK